MREIVIVGGGPSGALCGERLAQAGFCVTIFDEQLAWEKPCGGGLTYKAIEQYPFLLDNPYPKKLIRTCDLIASTGQRARLELDHAIVIYSRRALNGLLLERATQAGCNVVRSRVTQVDTRGPRVQVTLQEKSRPTAARQEADFAVVAAGARNAILPETTSLAPEDLELTLGYFVPAEQDVMKVKFLPGFEGYLWSFPRPDHLSVGICCKMAGNTSQKMKQHLHKFMAEEEISAGDAQLYSHVLPSPRAATLRARRVVGRNWALVGDAAAWVDPLTGEGLYYAMRSGDLLAQSLAKGNPEEYPARVREEFSAELEFATRVAQRFFRGRFLGGAVVVRMVQFIERSPTFRALVRDLFSGAQKYSNLRHRLWAQFGITFSEVLASLLRMAPACGGQATPAAHSSQPPVSV